MCPECFGRGQNARKECDDNIKLEKCRGNDMVCAVAIFGNEFHRGCLTRNEYKQFKAKCETSK